MPILGAIMSYNYVRDKEKSIKHFIDYMFNRCQAMFKYDGLPDTIPQRVLERYLQRFGHCIITRVKGELLPLNGVFAGVNNKYNEPSMYNVTNVALKLAKQYDLEKDCVLCRNDTQMLGLTPIFAKYGELLCENEISIRTTLILTRAMITISAPDERTRQSANEFLRKIENGELMCIGENAFFDGVKVNGFSANAGFLQQFVELEQYLKASCFNEIGINANFNMKRESITANEFALNDDFLLPLIDDMYKNRCEFVQKINDKYDTDIRVDFASSWRTTQAENEKELSEAEYESVLDDVQADDLDDDTTDTDSERRDAPDDVQADEVEYEGEQVETESAGLYDETDETTDETDETDDKRRKNG